MAHHKNFSRYKKIKVQKYWKNFLSRIYAQKRNEHFKVFWILVERYRIKNLNSHYACVGLSVLKSKSVTGDRGFGCHSWYGI